MKQDFIKHDFQVSQYFNADNHYIILLHSFDCSVNVKLEDIS